MAYNKSLLPTAYVAGAPSAAAEFKRYKLYFACFSGHLLLAQEVVI